MSTAAVLSSLAGQLRAARERRSLTLDELATRTGMSKAHLSRIESGERQPAIATLLVLADALDVRVGALLGEGDGPRPLSIHTPGGPTHSARGLEIEPCSSGWSGAGDLEALRVHIGADREPASAASHSGEEWLYVLAGTLVLEYDGETHTLAQGTAAHFDAQHPHRLRAPDTGADLLLVATAPPRRTAERHY